VASSCAMSLIQMCACSTLRSMMLMWAVVMGSLRSVGQTDLGEAAAGHP
jgi:hypothetical protein